MAQCVYAFTDPTFDRPCCSNVPPANPQPSPSHYTKTINFSVPIAQLTGWNDQTLESQFITQMAQQGHTISNFRVTYPNASTAQVDFDASSPPVLLVIAVILGIIAIIVYFISQIFVIVSHNPILQVGVDVLAFAALIGAVVVGAWYFKSRR